MAQIQLNDRVYKAAEQRAAREGFASVDDYVADLVTHDAAADPSGGTPNLDHLFTPERLAEIAEAEREIAAGNCLTADQAREHFKQKRTAWLQKNSPR